MKVLEEMRQFPFFLDEDQIRWVKDTFSKMDVRAKVGQLFCLCTYSADGEWINNVYEICEPGGFMYRKMPLEEAIHFTEVLNKRSEIPMLIAADVERGGSGMISDQGTTIGSPMAVAATGDENLARHLGEVSGAECAAVGGNWAFAPIIDINYNFRNPITNIRTFGSDPETVKNLGRCCVEEIQRQGVAASIKHFPGDGRDERDQHLVTTVNDMDCDAWMETYGAAYKAGIDAGVMTVMIGHIMLPSWSRRLRPGVKDIDLMPATLSPELMQDLLRGVLGFNGLVVTDSSTMVGFNSAMPRRKSVPYSIASGADMFLFPKNYEEDFNFMMEGIRDGIVTMERVNEAVLRVLGLKAALNLHLKKELPTMESALKVVGCKKHHKWARECAQKSVTIVKEEAGVLPVSPKKYPRIMVFPLEKNAGDNYYVPGDASDRFMEKLRDKGFTVSVFDPKTGLEGRAQPTTAVTQACDLILYLANMPTLSNQTQIRIEWHIKNGEKNGPIYCHEVPTIFVSLENPYHLLDAPRVQSYINTYGATEETMDAVIEKLMGRSPFTGVSPVDPFCGKWDTHLI